MKYVTAVVLLLCLYTAKFASAAPPHFEHIILVVQENRTPDNLFGGNPTFEQGVDIQQGSKGPWCLGACFSPDHSHDSWKIMWNGGGNSWINGAGACNIPIHDNCTGRVTRCNGDQVTSPPQCPPMTYVSASYDNLKVKPYFDIATRYGFANYFFQTNQGPSFPAHQFLFSGTSAPSGTVGNNTNYQYFAADNPSDGNGGSEAGCNAPTSFRVRLADRSGDAHTLNPVLPCFNHTSLPTLLGSGNWKYYVSNASDGPTSIWTAPNAIAPICKPLMGTGDCNGPDWVNSVIFGHKQIFWDLGTDQPTHSCDLRKVSWVIPNGKWSDHPGMKGENETDSTDIEGGPAWVASIINTLGNSSCTDTINGVQVPYWQDTVIFVVWDDWGGWWDHVNPASAPFLPVLLYDQNCSVWGCGDVYGFRVPFLVVSAYMAAGNGQTGYVSGDTRTPGGGEVAPYIHDFGSVLAFIENNFNLGIGNINSQYQFADFYAPELRADFRNIPLADFFCNAPCNPQAFRPIPLPPGAPDADYFINYTGDFTDPDNDAIDND